MKTLINDIKTGSFQHVYLLTGDEAYLKRQYRDKLCSAIVDPSDSMNFTVFEGNGISEGAVIDQAETMPFFAERRLIRLDNTGLFKGSSELLPDYLKQIPDYLYLVFTEGEADKRSRLYKAVRSAGRIVEFNEQTEATLTTWVLRRLAKEGLKIRQSDMSYLLSMTGTDMNTINLELDKLINYCAGNEVVTREDIDAIISGRLENHIFDMISAITAHNKKRAMDLYADLLALKEPPMRILYLIARQYNQLLIIKELSLMSSNINYIAEKAGIQPFIVRRGLREASSYTVEQLKRNVSLCIQFEEDVKSGRLSDRLSVELILLRLA